MKRHDKIVDTYVFNFKESVRGLTVGAPVDFRGIVVGEVAAIYTRYDPVKKEFSIPVEMRYYPERFTSRYESGNKGGRVVRGPSQGCGVAGRQGASRPVENRKPPDGQLYIALDFFPNAPKATMNWDATPPEIPTVPGGLQSLQDSVTALVAKLNKIPFEGIGKDVRQTLHTADTLLKTLDTSVAPEARATLRPRIRPSIRQPAPPARLRDRAEHRRHHARTVAHGGVVPRARRVSRTPSRGTYSWQAGG